MKLLSSLVKHTIEHDGVAYPVTLGVYRIMPADAERMLIVSYQQRPINKANLGKLVRAMDRGDFVFNGDTIKINDKGELLDGQHRLSACLEANEAIDAFVAQGIPEDYMMQIDTNKSRTITDLFRAKRVKNAPNAHKAMTVLWQLLRSEGDTLTADTPSQAEAYQLLSCFGDLDDNLMHSHIAIGNKIRRKQHLNSAAVSVLSYIYSTIDDGKNDEFWEGVRGVRVRSDRDPRHVLREYITQRREDKTDMSIKNNAQGIINAKNCLAWIHEAWTLYSLGKKARPNQFRPEERMQPLLLDIVGMARKAVAKLPGGAEFLTGQVSTVTVGRVKPEIDDDKVIAAYISKANMSAVAKDYKISVADVKDIVRRRLDFLS